MTRTPQRIVLYSGGQERRNALIHETLLDLALRGDSPRTDDVTMTYLPFTHEGAQPFFRRFQQRYRRFGATRFHCVAADDPALAGNPAARSTAVARIRGSHIVYLAGGNTFHFLAHLRRSGLLQTVAAFAARGGVVAGLSAGALILTPHIGLAGFPPFDADENRVGLTPRQCRGLGLVPFEFFPHFRRSRRYREALTAYSRRNRRTIYACTDGSGIVVEGDRFTAHGSVRLFRDGHEIRIGS